MVRGQNNTRHMVVLSGTTKYQVKDLKGKKRIIFNDGEWTSDIIDVHNIREARLSHKSGMPLRQWNISLNSSFISSNKVLNPDDETFEVCFYASNIFGGGMQDNFERVFGIKPDDNETTVSDFYTKLAKIADYNLNKSGILMGDFEVAVIGSTSVTNEFTATAFDNTKIKGLKIVVNGASESVSETSGVYTVTLTNAAHTVADLARVAAPYGITVVPNGTATTATSVSAVATAADFDSNGIAIREVAKKVSDADIYNRTMPYSYDVIITCREKIAYSDSASAYWINGLSERDASGNAGKYLKATEYAYRYNGVDIKDMEHYFARSRGNVYDMDEKANLRIVNSMNASFDAEYYILDIKYYHADKGAFDYASEKELTIATTTLTDFTTASTGLMALMGFSAPDGVTIGESSTNAFEKSSKTIYNAAASSSSVSVPKDNSVVLVLSKDVNQNNN